MSPVTHREPRRTMISCNRPLCIDSFSVCREAFASSSAVVIASIVLSLPLRRCWSPSNTGFWIVLPITDNNKSACNSKRQLKCVSYLHYSHTFDWTSIPPRSFSIAPLPPPVLKCVNYATCAEWNAKIKPHCHCCPND